MPVRKGSNRKWKIGSGPAVFRTKKKALAAQRAMHAKKRKKKRS